MYLCWNTKASYLCLLSVLLYPSRMLSNKKIKINKKNNSQLFVRFFFFLKNKYLKKIKIKFHYRSGQIFAYSNCLQRLIVLITCVPMIIYEMADKKKNLFEPWWNFTLHETISNGFGCCANVFTPSNRRYWFFYNISIFFKTLKMLGLLGHVPSRFTIPLIQFCVCFTPLRHQGAF